MSKEFEETFEEEFDRMVDERDEARAAFEDARDRNEVVAEACREARAVARRLAAIVRAFEQEAGPGTSGGELRRFDALAWAKDDHGT